MTCINFYFRSAYITHKHFFFTTHTLNFYIHLSLHSVLQDFPFHGSLRCDQGQITRFSIPKAILKIRNWKDNKLSEFETSVSAIISFPRNSVRNLKYGKKLKHSFLCNNFSVHCILQWPVTGEFGTLKTIPPRPNESHWPVEVVQMTVCICVKQEYVTWMQIAHGKKC